MEIMAYPCRLSLLLLAFLLLSGAHVSSFDLLTSVNHFPILPPRNVTASSSSTAEAAIARAFSANFLDAVNASPESTTGSAPLLTKATEADIERARKIVQDAQEKAGVLNRARMDYYARNK